MLSRKTFLLSIVLSCVLHAGALFYLHKHLFFFEDKNPVEFSQGSKTYLSKVNEQDILPVVIEKNEEVDLQENFSCNHLQKNEMKLAYEEKESLKETEDFPVFQKEKKLDEIHECLLDNKCPLNDKIEVENYSDVQVLISLLKEEAVKSTYSEIENEKPLAGNFSLKQEKEKSFFSTIRPDDKKDFKEGFKGFFSLKQKDNPCFTYPSKKGENTALFLPTYPKLPTLFDLNTFSCGNDFETSVEYVKNEDGDGYIFAITMIPKVGRNFKKIKQNFIFLVDKSNSIESRRYSSTRNAVISSLSALNKNDTFNIYAFDSKLKILFDDNKTISKDSLDKARNFLVSQKMGSFLNSKNLLLPFKSVLEKPFNENEINNVILLSNGDDLDKMKNCRFMKDWSSLNKGNNSLYVVSLAKDKNLPILDLFSSINNGKLVLANTIKGLSGRLTGLVKSLSYPVAKNISLRVYDQCNSGVVLFLPEQKRSHLYYNQPYVFIGTTQKLDDFVLFVQGRNDCQWFNIKKEISFDEATEGGESLKLKWAQYLANKCYEKYLEDWSVEHLDEAEGILKSFKSLKPAFR